MADGPLSVIMVMKILHIGNFGCNTSNLYTHLSAQDTDLRYIKPVNENSAYIVLTRK
jgi:hypothetical protein